MSYTRFALLIFLFAMLAVGIFGCSPQGSDPFLQPEGRYVSIHTIHWGNPATEPLAIYTSLSVNGDISKDGNRSVLESVTKLEVDFGDGSGWEDATAWLHDYLTPPYDNTTAGMIKHVYPAEGSYTPNVRATFWDGEVVYWKSQYTPFFQQITVPYSVAEHDGQPWTEP